MICQCSNVEIFLWTFKRTLSLRGMIFLSHTELTRKRFNADIFKTLISLQNQNLLFQKSRVTVFWDPKDLVSAKNENKSHAFVPLNW
jgi:hypothetical protein